MADQRVLAVCRAIVGQGLPREREPEPCRPDDATWREVFSRVMWERVSGLALAAVVAGWLEATDRQVDDLLGLHRDAMSWSLSVERKLVRLAEAFDAEGIEFAALKGASVAHTVYPDPSLRSFGDLDVLVRSADYERACRLLERTGHVRRLPEPRPGFEVRFGKASVHKHPDDRVEVDLHRTLVLGPFGLWIRPEELLERSTTFTLAGRSIRRLDDTGILLNVAMHASLGWRPPRLGALRDVEQVARHGHVDWDVLAAWSSRWRVGAVLQHAFATASATFGTRVADAAAGFVSARPPRGELRALAAYTEALREDGGTSTATLRAIPGIRGKAAYVFALAFPDREFLAARATNGRPSYLHRLMTPIGWVRPRLRRHRNDGTDRSLERTAR